MTDLLRYAFIDESGTVGSDSGTHFFVVAVLSADQPRELALPIRRALKKFGPSLGSGEIKAADFKETAILRLLQELARQEIEIVAVVLDQQVIKKLPAEKETLYRFAVTRAVQHLVRRFPRLEVVLDQRYTQAGLRYKLEKHIREGLEDLPHKLVLIRQENSVARKELQAADVIAWAFFQKYEHGDERFYEVIASKVVTEDLVRKSHWQREK